MTNFQCDADTIASLATAISARKAADKFHDELQEYTGGFNNLNECKWILCIVCDTEFRNKPNYTSILEYLASSYSAQTAENCDTSVLDGLDINAACSEHC